MNDFKLTDILLPFQKKFIFAKKRKKIWLSSRQVGKSTAVAFALLMKAAISPNSLSLAISTGSRAAQELLKKVVNVAEALNVAMRGRMPYDHNAESVTLFNGSRILSLPANPESLRGWSVRHGAVVIDEAAFLPFAEDIWQAILPTLTRDPSSELYVCSTPAGCQGLFYDLYSTADESWHVQTTTIHDAVKDGLKVSVDDLRKLCPDPEIFAMEYECQFSKEFGTFLDSGFLDFKDFKLNNFREYLGIDVGRHNDATAICRLLSDGQHFFVKSLDFLRNMPYAEQLAHVKRICQQHSILAGYVDSTGIGSAFAEQIEHEVSPKVKGFSITATSKNEIMERFRSLAFEARLHFDPALRNVVEAEIANTYRSISANGQVRFTQGHNSQGHGDGTVSIALAIQAAYDNQPSFQQPKPIIRSSAFGGWGSRLR